MLDLVPHFSSDTKLTVVYFDHYHDLKEAYKEAGIPVIFADLKGSFTFIQGIRKLMTIIKQEKPDIIISSLLRANIISRIACKLTGTKLIGTFVSDSYSEQRSASFSLKRKAGAAYYYWLDRLTSGIPVAWISNSQSIKKSNCAALHLSEQKVTVIYRGRSTGLFKQWVPPVNHSGFHFASVGRLYEPKGFYEMITAFNEVCKRYPEIKLDIYGDGPYRNKLTTLINDLQLQEKITLHGNIKNAWQKLYEADCFVFSSWYEGFSGALVEAMMTGIPIIASDIPMNLEAVAADDTALIHRVKDKDSIVQKMTEMITADPVKMQEMGKRARAAALSRFDMKMIAHEYETFVREQIKKA